MNQKVVNWISLVLGFSTGLFLTFFITVTVLYDKFDKPWDVLWSTVNSIVGALLGSLLGGMIAYLVSIRQSTFQNELAEENQKKAQDTLSKRIKSELSNNTSPVTKLNRLLTETKDDFPELSKYIAIGESEVIEGLIVYINQIEINLLIQLRNNLIDLDYIDLHKRIDCLEKIKNAGELLQSQKVPEYINVTLKRLLSLTIEFQDTID
ncbi:hypothetical protein ACE8FZ_19930 [Peribacillus frigoritolerans]|uniref:hypothetical protein n=1 Tax=Peribacillus frigoritolerans TaxID=450367 RepID=UPI0035CEC39E